MTKLSIIKLMAVLCTMALLAGCENDPMGTQRVDESFYALTSKDAMNLAGRNTIPRRATSYTLKTTTAPKLHFERPSELTLRKRLASETVAVLGDNAAGAEIVDNGSTLSLKLERGVAWIAKHSGAITLKTHDGVRAQTRIRNAEEAVNLALEQIEQADLLSLVQDETLDVVSVVSTHHAGWKEVGGQMVPVHFGSAGGEDGVTQFKSEYTVHFGRRYRDIPIIGPALSVRLDAEGRMVSFIKNWRNISGISKRRISVLPQSKIDAKRDPGMSAELDLKRVQCGYFEDSSVGYYQVTPGVGCRYVYHGKGAENTLGGEVSETVNASTSDAPALTGKKLEFETGGTEPSKGQDLD